MIERIIRFSVRQKLLVGLFTIALIAAGTYSLQHLPIDAVPDITNNQVQIVTVSSALAPQEVEQFITYPVEVAMANIPRVEEIRSISRFGLSVVTVVFEDAVPILEARQFVKEQIDLAVGEISPEMGRPELMPITTGLGEIYQYVLRVEPGYEHQYGPMELRTIQDWIVKRQLAGIPGIIETSSFGGYLKQYEVAVDPLRLEAYGIAISELFTALERNNQNSGGSYIEKGPNAFYIRTEGLVESIEHIEQIVVALRNNSPVLVRDIAQVQLGSPKRYGAMTMDGVGEAVGGITLMLKGANSSQAIANVHDRIDQVRRSLPEGVLLEPYLDRSALVAKTIETVKENLLTGGAIVILVLIFLLGNWRAGFIVASVIPLSMLFTVILMQQFGVSANLMSLGAIDFGIVIDGAVIIIEGVLFTLGLEYAGRQLTQKQMDDLIVDSSSQLFRSAVFGVFIILVVFIPIMTLTGIEGKMFRPMALTFSFAILGALLLSLTYVPMMAAWVFPRRVQSHGGWSERLMDRIKTIYRPLLSGALRLPFLVLGIAISAVVIAAFIFSRLGAEFIPTLEEGDLAMQMTLQPGSALSESIRASTRAERILLREFPEVKHVVSKIGTAEVPTDPMAVEDADIMIILKPKEEWTSANGREQLVEKMKAALSSLPGVEFEFTQPIQLRFNELMTGAKTDIAVKIFGEENTTLARFAEKAAGIIEPIPGAADVRVEQTEGLQQLRVRYKREKVAEYGLNIEDLNTIIRTAFAGEVAGAVFENERKFDLVVRLKEAYRQDVDLNHLYIHPRDRIMSIPLSEVAELNFVEGPMQISRESARRRITIGVNVRERDVASLVQDIQTRLETSLDLPPGYSIEYGGAFEHLKEAQSRLVLAVPVALGLIFLLLFFTFGRFSYALLVFSAVPMAALGGIIALWIRGMPFSISAGVGFIALFGVAVLNGIVLISYFNRIWLEQPQMEWKSLILEGAQTRLRPVLMTATVAALGFLPMALSTSNGAEVQKPLATVVIGGLVSATILTLLVLPVLYYLLQRKKQLLPPALPIILLLLIPSALPLHGQAPLSLETALDSALLLHPELRNASLRVQQARLGLDAAWELPPASLDLGLGQINTAAFDYHFSIQQGLGQIGRDKARKELAQTRISLAEGEQSLLELELIRDMHLTFDRWVFETQSQDLLSRLYTLYQDFETKARLQLEAGQINALEYALVQNALTRLGVQLAERENARVAAFRELRERAWLKGEYQPSDTLYAPIAFPLGDRLDQRLTKPWQLQVEEERNQRNILEASMAGQWRFGYFNQSIRPDWSLQGALLGLDIPIFRKADKTRVEIQQLEQAVAGNQLLWAEHRFESQAQELSLQAQNWDSELRDRGDMLKAQAAQLRRLSRQQLEAGAIDYFEYLRSLEAALQTELEYLKLVHCYNQAVIGLEFFKE